MRIRVIAASLILVASGAVHAGATAMLGTAVWSPAHASMAHHQCCPPGTEGRTVPSPPLSHYDFHRCCFLRRSQSFLPACCDTQNKLVLFGLLGPETNGLRPSSKNPSICIYGDRPVPLLSINQSVVLRN